MRERGRKNKGPRQMDEDGVRKGGGKEGRRWGETAERKEKEKKKKEIPLLLEEERPGK